MSFGQTAVTLRSIDLIRSRRAAKPEHSVSVSDPAWGLGRAVADTLSKQKLIWPEKPPSEDETIILSIKFDVGNYTVELKDKPLAVDDPQAAKIIEEAIREAEESARSYLRNIKTFCDGIKRELDRKGKNLSEMFGLK